MTTGEVVVEVARMFFEILGMLTFASFTLLAGLLLNDWRHARREDRSEREVGRHAASAIRLSGGLDA